MHCIAFYTTLVAQLSQCTQQYKRTGSREMYNVRADCRYQSLQLFFPRHGELYIPHAGSPSALCDQRGLDTLQENLARGHEGVGEEKREEKHVLTDLFKFHHSNATAFFSLGRSLQRGMVWSDCEMAICICLSKEACQ